jgi:cyclopropane-fatty-acyl-phospholipid synthase
MEFFVAHVQRYVPDWIVRFGLRYIMKLTTNDLRKKDWPQKEQRLVERINQMDDITFEADAANQQHYQVPTDFFLAHLGSKLKYSSCEWDNGIKTIESAEEYTINEYQKHMKLDELLEGDTILEIGNGWGSLCLSNAKKYPHLNFESFSNSTTQIEYIGKQIANLGLTNLKIWKQDIDEFVKTTTTDDAASKYARIVSIECIEHCRNYKQLFRKLKSILRGDGFCFFQILGHREYSYLMNNKSWMGRNFFTGGTIPSMHLFSYFTEDLIVTDRKIINGSNYSKTLDAWLNQMYEEKTSIMQTFKQSYGSDAEKMYQGWRMFYLMCSESFGYNHGTEWCVGYFTMRKR